MLHEVGLKIQLLNFSFKDLRPLNPQNKEAYFECGLAILSLLSAIVKFMRIDNECTGECCICFIESGSVLTLCDRNPG